jgi:hypothetical protein
MMGSPIRGEDSDMEKVMLGPASCRLPENGGRSDFADWLHELAISIEEVDGSELAPFDPLATLERVRSRQETGAAQP